MNYVKALIYLIMFDLVITTVSNSLGITKRVIEYSNVVTVDEEIGALEALLFPFVWVFNSLGSFMQLLTFNADIPPLLGIFFVTPVGLTVALIVILIIRGVG